MGQEVNGCTCLCVTCAQCVKQQLRQPFFVEFKLDFCVLIFVINDMCERSISSLMFYSCSKLLTISITFILVGVVGVYPHTGACPHTLLFAHRVTSG